MCFLQKTAYHFNFFQQNRSIAAAHIYFLNDRYLDVKLENLNFSFPKILPLHGKFRFKL
jgi:hypothetical protein